MPIAGPLACSRLFHSARLSSCWNDSPFVCPRRFDLDGSNFVLLYPQRRLDRRLPGFRHGSLRARSNYRRAMSDPDVQTMPLKNASARLQTAPSPPIARL
ncbi:hypothetical protein L1887_61877 [Cichorium endivia]|nr:hypothetical protein L1887_61877 [Cichorium endivia]